MSESTTREEVTIKLSYYTDEFRTQYDWDAIIEEAEQQIKEKEVVMSVWMSE